MTRRVQVTFDANDPHRLAAWWAELLGGAVEDNHDAVSQLLETGVVTEEEVLVIDGRRFFADAAAVQVPDGSAPRLYFQRVPEAKSAKNRVHLDIPVEPDDLDRRVTELREEGATLVRFDSHPGHRWAVLQDPEGNEFCLH